MALARRYRLDAGEEQVEAEGEAGIRTHALAQGRRVLNEPLMEEGGVRGAGSSRTGPGRVVGDKGYNHGHIRRFLVRRGIASVIPLRYEQGYHCGFDREAYRQRNRVERLIGRLKQWRRIATRYEKRAATHLAMLTLTSIVLWL